MSAGLILIACELVSQLLDLDCQAVVGGAAHLQRSQRIPPMRIVAGTDLDTRKQCNRAAQWYISMAVAINVA